MILLLATLYLCTGSNGETCCEPTNQQKCSEANVNTKLVKSEAELTINSVTVAFVSMLSTSGYVYKNTAGDEAVITLNPKTGIILGHFKTQDGKSFALEKCSQGYFWKELEDEAISEGESRDGKCSNCVFPFLTYNKWTDRCTTLGGYSPYCMGTDGGWLTCTDSACPGMTANPEEQVSPHPYNQPGNCYCGITNRKEKARIVGGDLADTGEFPWQVGLLGWGGSTGNYHTCGGTLLGEFYVVTAAHCVDGGVPSDYKVRIGDTIYGHDLEAESFTIDVAEILQHPGYNNVTLSNDIAVLKLASKISLTDYAHIKPACLPTEEAVLTGEATVSGWGNLATDTISTTWLNHVDVTIFEDGDCGYYSYYGEGVLCAGAKEGGKGICQGDSGGPLVVSDPDNNHAMSLAGVVSFTINGCATSRGLGGFADVSHFLPWLNSQMTDLTTCPPPPSGWDSGTATTTTATITTDNPIEGVSSLHFFRGFSQMTYSPI